jgi:hypothetical protein
VQDGILAETSLTETELIQMLGKRTSILVVIDVMEEIKAFDSEDAEMTVGLIIHLPPAKVPKMLRTNPLSAPGLAT